MLFFPLPCCGLQQKPICSKGYLLIIWLCKLFGFASLKLVRFVLCLYSLIHHYFQGLITNCFLKMMHWWKCERKITMALFAKKKMESLKKNFINFFFFFYHFSAKIQLSFLYPIYIRLLNILCVYFQIFYKILLPWLCKLTVIWVLNQSWKNLNLRSASCLFYPVGETHYTWDKRTCKHLLSWVWTI